MTTRQLAIGAIRLVAIAGFVRFALPFFAALGEFVTAGWLFPTTINAVTALGTLIVVALVWSLAPLMARAIVGDGELSPGLSLDVARLILLGFAIVGLVIFADGIVTLAEEIVQSYAVAFQPGIGVAPPTSPDAGAIVGAAIQVVIGAIIFFGRQGLATLVRDFREF